MTDGSRSDEGSSRDHAGSLLPRNAGDRGALQLLALMRLKLRIARTEARRVCVNMATGVVVSIGREEVLEKCSGNRG